MNSQAIVLRPELLPPVLAEQLVAELARLADRLDGNPDEALREEFNRLAGTTIPMEEFQGISGGEECEEYVRRVLFRRMIRPVEKPSRAELVEVIRRAMTKSNSWKVREAYMAIFDANVPRQSASNLMFYPPDYDPQTNTWGGGQSIGVYDPTPEQIVDWALAT